MAAPAQISGDRATGVGSAAITTGIDVVVVRLIEVAGISAIGSDAGMAPVVLATVGTGSAGTVVRGGWVVVASAVAEVVDSAVAEVVDSRLVDEDVPSEASVVGEVEGEAPPRNVFTSATRFPVTYA